MSEISHVRRTSGSPGLLEPGLARPSRPLPSRTPNDLPVGTARHRLAWGDVGVMLTSACALVWASTRLVPLLPAPAGFADGDSGRYVQMAGGGLRGVVEAPYRFRI